MAKKKQADDPADALRKTIAEIAESPTSDYETEPKVLFKPGKWKDGKYTVAQCKEYVQNYLDLAKRNLTPGIIVGHDVLQKMAHAFGFDFDIDGLPTLGEVRMWWDEKQQAVMHTLGSMPEKLATLIENRRYKTVSATVIDEWHDDVEGRTRKNVIPFVSVIGLQWPGMQGMTDQLAVANDGVTYAITFAGQTVRAVTIPVEEIEPFEEGGGDEDMELKELQAKYDALRDKLAEFEAAPHKEALAALMAEWEDVDTVEGAKDKIVAMKAEIKTYKDLDEKAKKAAAAKAKEGAETRIDEVLENAVTDGVIDPAQKDAEKVHLMSQDYQATTHRFADESGKEIEGTQLDQAIATFKMRKGTRKFSESGAGTEVKAPGAGLPDETPGEKKAREGFGYDRDPKTGECIEPKKAE